jgi:DNA-binding MarR family transcriptional regulator
MPSQDASRARDLGDTLQFMQTMWKLAHALEVRSKRMARDLGVTGPQRLAIRVLGQHPDLTARELADLLGLHPSTLTGVLARLEESKLITRTVDAEDRRRARFRLTAAGKKVDKDRAGTVEASVRRAMSKAGNAKIATTQATLALLADELERE